MKKVPSLTKEFIYAEWTATVDPTQYSVQFAIVAEGTDPDSGDWVNGEWHGLARQVQVGYEADARALIGPLAKGRYSCFTRLSDANLEVPVREFDLLVAE